MLLFCLHRLTALTSSALISFCSLSCSMCYTCVCLLPFISHCSPFIYFRLLHLFFFPSIVSFLSLLIFTILDFSHGSYPGSNSTDPRAFPGHHSPKITPSQKPSQLADYIIYSTITHSVFLYFIHVHFP